MNKLLDNKFREYEVVYCENNEVYFVNRTCKTSSISIPQQREAAQTVEFIAIESLKPLCKRTTSCYVVEGDQRYKNNLSSLTRLYQIFLSQKDKFNLIECCKQMLILSEGGEEKFKFLSHLLELFVKQQNIPEAVECYKQLCDFHLYYGDVGVFHEYLPFYQRWYEDLLRFSESDSDKLIIMKILSDICANQNNHAGKLIYLENQLEFSKTPEEQAKMLKLLCIGYHDMQMAEYEDKKNACIDAMNILINESTEKKQWSVLYTLSDAFAIIDDQKNLFDCYQLMLKIAETNRQKRDTFERLGMFYCFNDLDNAIQCNEQALEFSESIEDKCGALYNLYKNYSTIGDVDKKDNCKNQLWIFLEESEEKWDILKILSDICTQENNINEKLICYKEMLVSSKTVEQKINSLEKLINFYCHQRDIVAVFHYFKLMLAYRASNRVANYYFLNIERTINNFFPDKFNPEEEEGSLF